MLGVMTDVSNKYFGINPMKIIFMFIVSEFWNISKYIYRKMIYLFIIQLNAYFYFICSYPLVAVHYKNKTVFFI